jgi:hypothetical protein
METVGTMVHIETCIRIKTKKLENVLKNRKTMLNIVSLYHAFESSEIYILGLK